MTNQPSSSISSFTKKEVDHIFKITGSRVKTDFFDIIFANKSKDFSRLLVITSRKIGNAPKRNKLRRRLKSIFIEEKLFNSAYDCVIIAKPGSVSLSFDQLKAFLISIYESKK